MSIEEEIKQSQFHNPFEKAFVNVIYTANYFHGLNLHRFKPFGLSPEQYNVLRILKGSHPKKMSLSDISCRMLDKNSNATRLVEKLRLKGLVERELCASDRRQVEISITPKGAEILEAIAVEMKAWFAQYHNISPEEALQISDLLDKMRG